MEWIDPEDSVEHIKRRLPNNGCQFLLCDALAVLQDFYVNVRFNDCEDDDDKIVAVAGRYGHGKERRVEFGLYRAFGLTARLEIQLWYPVGLRSLFLKRALELCSSPSDAEQYFYRLRSLSWFRRFASISPTHCSIRWQGIDELVEMYIEIIPKLLGANCAIPRTADSNSGH